MAKKNLSQCHYPRCRQFSTLIWLRKPLCDKHWIWASDNKQKAFKKLKYTTKELKEIKKYSEEN